MAGQQQPIPSPNFSSPPTPTSDFLGFSSSPITGKDFKPKWGKKNRSDNWNRFGQSQASTEGGHQSPGWGNERGYHTPGRGRGYTSPGQRGRGFTPPGQRGGGYVSPGQRGSGQTPPGGYSPSNRGYGYTTPRGGYSPGYSPSSGYSPNYSPQSPQYTPGGGRSRDGYTPTPKSHSQGFFMPSMLMDPWEELEREMGWGKEKSIPGLTPSNKSGQGSSKKPLAPFYRTGGDGETERKQWERSKIMGDEDDSFQEEENVTDNQDEIVEDTKTRSLSDSLIPQVGDSLCERNSALDDTKGEGQEGQKTILKVEGF